MSIRKQLTVAVMVVCTAAFTFGAETQQLAAGFENPPASARPQTWWHWIHGNITREGITADLEAMKSVGIGGAHIFNIGPGDARVASIPQVRFMSEQWQKLFLHAVREADRLGLTIGMNSCPGWANNGGPWIDAEHSMQALTFSRVEVEGCGEQTLILPRPWSTFGWYRDVAVVAYPVGVTMAQLKPKVTASSPIDGEVLMDGRWETQITLPEVKEGEERFIQFEFETPVLIEAMWFRDFESPGGSNGGVLEVSLDGAQFRTVTNFDYHFQTLRYEGNIVHEGFRPTKGKFFRIRFDMPRGGKYRVGEVDLMMVPTVKGLQHKGAYRSPHWPNARYGWSASRADGPNIPLDRVINLTDKMDASGQLTWKVPKGRWTILRVGHTSNGVAPRPLPGATWSGCDYRPATPEARPDDGISNSLECDKLSKAATKIQYENYTGKLAKLCGSLTGKVLNSVTIDSWEVGAQNWTAQLPEEFKQRRGYDLMPYFPLLLTGAVVESVEHSERFLEDLRRTLQELFLENHFGHFRELAHQDNLTLQAENYHHIFSDTLDVIEFVDAPMAEFWSIHPDQPEIRPTGYWRARHAQSGSQVYGWPVVPAEAFTSIGRYTQSPKMLKDLGDLMFAGGINQFVFHTYAHQPWLDKKPGAIWGVGFHMNRNNTWWEESAGWLTYIQRCQAMLQQGRGVGQVVVLMPRYEPGAMSRVEGRDLEIRQALPKGIGYIYASQAGLINKSQLDNGAINFPLGAGYRMVVLPDTDSSSPELLEKLEELLNAGVAVYATKRPARALGIHRKQNAQVQKMAAALWGDIDGKKVTHRRVGKGLLIQGISLAEAVELAGIEPDFVFANVDGSPIAKYPELQGLSPINFLHRRTDEKDFYFVANYTQERHQLVGRFGVTGMAPAWWDPVSGQMEAIATWREVDGATEVPLDLGPAASGFVVFQAVATMDPIVSLKYGGEELFPPFEQSDGSPESKMEEWFITLDDQGEFCLQTAMAGTFTATTADGKRFNIEAPALPAPIEIAGPWQVDFEPGLGAPATATFPELISWSDHSDEGIRYFSGHATYNTTFSIPPALLRDGQRFRLDLGNVEVAATVTVNGKNMGILWHAPYAVDVTDALKAGENTLAVRVVNLWPNRLIGDQRLPKEKHVAFTVSTLPYNADSKLLPSGLLGPVRLRAESVLPFQQKIMTKE